MSEQEPIQAEIVPAESPTPLSVIQMAVKQGANVETLERLVALQEKMLARQAEIEFNEALNRIQSKIKSIAPDLENPQTQKPIRLLRSDRPRYSAHLLRRGFQSVVQRGGLPKARACPHRLFCV